MAYATLGDITFEGLVAPSSFASELKANYAQHALIENKPRLQRLGTDLETINLSMRFHRSFCNPEIELWRLYRHLERGTILPFTHGNGVYQGRFVVQSVNADYKRQFADGTVLYVEVEVSLLEVWEAGDEAKAKYDGFANAETEPTIFVGELEQDLGGAFGASAAVNAIISEAQVTNQLITEAGVVADVADTNLQMAGRSISKQEAAALKLNALVNDVSSNIYTAAAQVRNYMATYNGALGLLKSVVTAGNVAASITNNAAYQGIAQELRTKSYLIRSMSSIRR
jgi:phage protein U